MDTDSWSVLRFKTINPSLIKLFILKLKGVEIFSLGAVKCDTTITFHSMHIKKKDY